MLLAKKNPTIEQKIPFVFMDESGKKESDRFFVCGFLQVDDNIAFSRALQRVSDQIKNLSIRNKQERVSRLYKDQNINELFKLAQSFSEFEMKHYRITNENQSLYCDLVKAFWAKTKFRFTAIVVDRNDPKYIRDKNEHNALYLRALKLFAKHCAPEIQYVYVPDNFDIYFDWNMNSGRLPIAVMPLDSKSCLQLQVVDVLTGLIAQGLRMNSNEEKTARDIIRQPVLETLEKLTAKKIRGNVTIKTPQYFSVWVVDFSKTKESGHGQEIQPRL